MDFQQIGLLLTEEALNLPKFTHEVFGLLLKKKYLFSAKAFSQLSSYKEISAFFYVFPQKSVLFLECKCVFLLLHILLISILFSKV